MFPDTFGFGYKLVLLLHIVAVIAAFAPGFVWPGAMAQLRKQGKPVGPTISELAYRNTHRVHGPALVVAGILGLVLVVMSKPEGASDAAWEFSQPWVSVALLIWFILMGLVFGVLAPAEKRSASGDAGAERIVLAVGGAMHLLVTIQIILMIWKPGA